jgi:alpha-beta hydrolase superfamily lysophospholipase
MKHIETNWHAMDGLNIYAQSWEPEILSPKAVVCLVHGIGEHSNRYAHVAEAFTKAGYALFGADLRGHGKSEGPRGHFPSIDAVVQDIDLLLDHARIGYPGVPLILYGHSLGGILVLYYGLKQKPDVEGIIATSSGLRTALEKQPAKILAAKILGSLMPGVSLPTGLDQNAISQDKEVVAIYAADPLVHDRMSLGFGKIMLSAIRWIFEHAKEFSLPLLLMHGKSDSIAYPSGSEEISALVKEKSKLVLWENGWHELHNEPFKEKVFKTMISWMDGLTKK